MDKADQAFGYLLIDPGSIPLIIRLIFSMIFR